MRPQLYVILGTPMAHHSLKIPSTNNFLVSVSRTYSFIFPAFFASWSLTVTVCPGLISTSSIFGVWKPGTRPGDLRAVLRRKAAVALRQRVIGAADFVEECHGYVSSPSPF